MKYDVVFNETLLNISDVRPGFADVNRYVTIQSCKDYISVTSFWNHAYELMIAVLLIMFFYLLFKQGRLEWERKKLKGVIDGIGNDDVDNHDNDRVDVDNDADDELSSEDDAGTGACDGNFRSHL